MTVAVAMEAAARAPAALDAPEEEHVPAALGNSPEAGAAAQMESPTTTPQSTNESARLGGTSSASQSAGDEDGESEDDDGQEPSAPAGPLPSKGSALHASGQCTRCCFYFKGRCRNGLNCQFCHMQHEKRSRGRGCRGHGTTKKAAAAAAAAAALAQAAALATAPVADVSRRSPPPGLEDAAPLAGPIAAPPVRHPFLSTAPTGNADAARLLAATKVQAVTSTNRAAFATGSLFSTTPNATGQVAKTAAVVLSTVVHPKETAGTGVAREVQTALPPAVHPQVAPMPERRPAAPIFGTTPANRVRAGADVEAPPTLPRLLGTTGRWRPQMEATKPQAVAAAADEAISKRVHEPEDMPVKVVLAEAYGAVPKLDPSVPVKKRVPQWM